MSDNNKIILTILAVGLWIGLAILTPTKWDKKTISTLTERLDKIYADFYGNCSQCHDGLTGDTPEEQEEMLYKILRGTQ